MVLHLRRQLLIPLYIPHMETLTYWSLPGCSLVCWSGSGADWLAGRTLSGVPFTLELHKFSRDRDRLLMAASFTLPLLLLLLLLWIFPATVPFPAGSWKTITIKHVYAILQEQNIQTT